MSFLITGFGRSGTKFLSNVMSRDPRWNIWHEPRGREDEEFFNCLFVPNQIQKAFKQDFYGEVNSRLRFYVDRIKADQKGIIIRNPQDIFLSTMNRGKNAYKMARDIFLAYQFFNMLDGILFIDFSKMVFDRDYLTKIIRYFDVQPILQDGIEPVNQNKIIHYNSFNDLPSNIKKEYNKYNWKSLMKKLNSKIDKNI